MKSDELRPETDPAVWLKSPVSEMSDRLMPPREMRLLPYNGKRRTFKLFRTQYLIGSGEECDIRIDDPFLSLRHAELRLGKRGYEIRDLGSRNGVYLNGVRVESAPLLAHGELRLGRSTLSWWGDRAHEELTGQWVVADPFMQETVERLKAVARSPLPVLLLGETGTGKEFLARLLHNFSSRHSSPYVIVNGALTGGPLAESELFGHGKGAFTGAESSRRGALRSASGGTLFLDEVADIPSSAQTKLLRALEGGEVKSLGSDSPERVDIRLVSATSQDLEEKIRKGDFRMDLYYRLAGFVVHVPPLRDRPRDILAIAEKMLEKSGFQLDEECRARLLSYRWPGNVRELRSCIGRAETLARSDGSKRLLKRHLDGMESGFSPVPPVDGRRVFTLDEIEREGILRTLERNGWSKGVTARELGIARSTLFEKMRKYSLRNHSRDA